MIKFVLNDAENHNSKHHICRESNVTQNVNNGQGMVKERIGYLYFPSNAGLLSVSIKLG